MNIGHQTKTLLLRATGLVRSVARRGIAIRALIFFSIGLISPVDGSAKTLSETVDQAVNAGLKELQVPGAAVAVVQNGEIVLSRGYGVKQPGGTRVDGDTTGFRVASITKLFTATAAMQLVEDEQLDLHQDIDTYLDVPVPRSFDSPITLHHLLTHTAGYDNTDIGDAGRTARDLIPLTEIPERWPVAQTTPPGYAYRYSNYGYTLAGLVIEQVSGLAYADYMRERVLQPLGMRYSSLAQPLPRHIRTHLATSYHLEGNELVPLPLDYSQVAPADVLVTTAGDMAQFMLAHLAGGGALLQPESIARMHAQQYSGNPSHYGMAYGFQEHLFRGMRVLEHHGGQLGFASWMFLIPEENLGVFIAQNRREPELRRRLRDAILDIIAPDFRYPEMGLQPKPDAADSLRRFAGRYRDASWNRSTFEKSAWWLGMIGAASTVDVSADGALLIDGQRYVQTGPLEFTHENFAVWTRGFRTDDTGRITHQTSGRVVMEKIPWYLHKHSIQLSLATALVLGVWMALGWPLARRKRIGATPGQGWVLIVSGWIWIMAIVVFIGVLWWASDQPVQLDYGPPWWIFVTLTLTTAAALTPPFLTVAAWRGWLHSSWALPQSIAATLFAVFSWIAAGYLFALNLVGYQLGY